MNGLHLAFLVLTLMLAGGKADKPSQHATHKPYDRTQHASLKTVARASENFTNALYSAMSRQEGNIIFSPISIHSILTMTSLGAAGKTKAQMRGALNLPSEDMTKIGYKEISKRIGTVNTDKVLLKMANKVYVNKGVHLKEFFLNKSREVFATEAEGIDFSDETASETINAWVENHTNNRIQNLVGKDTLDASTAMVLVNAIYFKGKWQTEFEPQDTVTKPFYVTKERSVSVPMMSVTNTFRFKEIQDSDTKVLELPYFGGSVKMMILLPNERDGLTKLETDLRTNGLRKYFRMWNDVEVDLWLPKFRLEQSTQLENQLIKMGMTEMFTDLADFSAMVGKLTKTKVSNVAHKAFIEVNEEGTEAAAATMVGIQTLSLNSYDPTVVFHADHPFIFLLYHKDSKAVIFMGRFSTPE